MIISKRDVVLSLLVCTASVSCATVSSPSKYSVYVDQDVQITSEINKVEQKMKGQKIDFDEPLLIESPGYVGLLVVPINDKANLVKVSLKPIEELGGEQIQKQNNLVLNDLVNGINDIQILLSTNKSKEALTKVEEIQVKYPKVSHLKFLKASCLVVQGERAKARVILSEALKEFPDNENAKQLLQSLSRQTSTEGGAR